MQARQFLGSKALSATVLIRLMVGWVFMSEGIQKFLFPDALGIGRFTKIGIPAPQFFAPFVGVVEIVCGALLIVGLLTRLARSEERRVGKECRSRLASDHHFI